LTGSLFFALKGANFNANEFALSALEKGCAYAIVDEAEYAIDERFILVDNVLESLQQLAKYHRKQLGTKIIGITGTNGKTTTKELLASVLSEKYNVLYTLGNLNNHIGVPLTLLRLKPEHDIAVIEMGANHPGDIAELAEIAQPDFGLITNVGKAHLEGFGSFDGVKQTKSELYKYILDKGKLIFINKANLELLDMANKSGLIYPDKMYSYSMEFNDMETMMAARVSSCSPFLEMECQSKNDESFEIKTKLIGSYNAENVLAAVTIGKYFGLDEIKIINGLENYLPQNNRSQLTITDKNHLIVDAYNANPTSMSAAILNFSHLNTNRKSLILGDMLELGVQSEMEHQTIISLINDNQFETVILVGEMFSKTKNAYLNFKTVIDAILYLKDHRIENNYVLIKGSRGIKLEKIIEVL
jgi:UDP-N-acetylmuramoyl-tripeptide--D-alanyl-D-alanine ligase